MIIHGIGEQRPMSTLRDFVHALTGGRCRSKPDPLAESFELRRLDYEEGSGEDKRTTHFYEYYWAYRMNEPRLAFVIDWALRLLVRPVLRMQVGDLRTVPPQHPRLYSLFVGSWMALVLLGLLAWQFGPAAAAVATGSLAMIAWLAKHALSNFALNWVGDAARYLNAAPSNVAERQQIRADGVRLLRRLHDQGKSNYDRVVIVGHSLGSVIGYDMLKHYWIEAHSELPIDTNLGASALQSVEESGSCAEQYHPAQADLADCIAADVENQSRISRWKITDFLTLGSPLSYGAFLLAESCADFRERCLQRELPTCPPVRNGAGDLRPDSFAWQDEESGSLYLHHAAQFAITKWTNFYFPGDLVGGKLAPVFGSGILDVPLYDGPSSWKFRSHVWYWRTSRDASRCVMELRKILGFDVPFQAARTGVDKHSDGGTNEHIQGA